MSRVVLQSLEKIYGEGGKDPFRAVKGIDLEIDEGEFMVFVGPSGCGKSTTLRMIAGLETITGGELCIGEKVMNRVAPKDRGVAMVFQNYALYPHMSVFDNMAFGLKIRKQPKREIEERVHRAAETLGLSELLERKPGALSGGQRQRVALGRAIVREPDVFLFDEPLSNLDAKMRVEMRAEILAMHRRVGATMIYVTHDQVEAMTMGQRICLMNDGEIVQVDRPLDLYHRPNSLFSAGFIGSPPMNLLDGKLVGAGDGIEFQGRGFSIPIPIEKQELLRPFLERAIHLGFRPEGLTLTEDTAERGPRGQVDFCEAMGAETIVHLRLDSTGEKVSARIAGDQTFAPGQASRLGIDLLSTHWFDPATGRAIIEKS